MANQDTSQHARVYLGLLSLLVHQNGQLPRAKIRFHLLENLTKLRKPIILTAQIMAMRIHCKFSTHSYGKNLTVMKKKRRNGGKAKGVVIYLTHMINNHVVELNSFTEACLTATSSPNQDRIGHAEEIWQIFKTIGQKT